jgi:hypothetical protein
LWRPRGGVSGGLDSEASGANHRYAASVGRSIKQPDERNRMPFVKVGARQLHEAATLHNSGHAIPDGARIIGICEAMDAMTQRLYRTALVS